MVTLNPGTQAPPIPVERMSGAVFSLLQALEARQVAILVFFKPGCSICRLTLPFLERLYMRFPESTVWGICDGSLEEAGTFAAMAGASFPILLDGNFELARQYGVVAFPSIFLIDRNGIIQTSSTGFVRADLEDMCQNLSRIFNTEETKLFTELDDVPTLQEALT